MDAVETAAFNLQQFFLQQYLSSRTSLRFVKDFLMILNYWKLHCSILHFFDQNHSFLLIYWFFLTTKHYSCGNSNQQKPPKEFVGLKKPRWLPLLDTRRKKKSLNEDISAHQDISQPFALDIKNGRQKTFKFLSSCYHIVNVLLSPGQHHGSFWL